MDCIKQSFIARVIGIHDHRVTDVTNCHPSSFHRVRSISFDSSNPVSINHRHRAESTIVSINRKSKRMCHVTLDVANCPRERCIERVLRLFSTGSKRVKFIGPN